MALKPDCIQQYMVKDGVVYTKVVYRSWRNWCRYIFDSISKPVFDVIKNPITLVPTTAFVLALLFIKLKMPASFIGIFIGAIAFDSSASNSGSGTSVTISHTCSGSDRMLVITAASSAASGVSDWSGATYNGVSMTMDAHNIDASTSKACAVFHLAAPATGANNAVISLVSVGLDQAGFTASFTGADSTIGAFGANKGLGPASGLQTKSMTTSRDNSYVVDAFGSPGGRLSYTGTGNQVQIGGILTPLQSYGGSYNNLATAGTISFAWTLSSSSFYCWAYIEVMEKLVTTLAVNVGDDIALTEALTMLLTSNINVNDAITVSESITMDLGQLGGINVNDAITITESVSLEFVNTINVGEDITVTESVIVTNTFLGDISVNDAITVSESITMFNQLGGINVNDTITITEMVLMDFIYGLLVGEDISVSEAVTMDLGQLGDISVNDAITVSESIIVDNSQLPDIMVFDSITISEDLAMFLPLPDISVFDAISVAESVIMEVTLDGISVSDTITITEFAGITLVAPRAGLIHMRSGDQNYPLGMDNAPGVIKMRPNDQRGTLVLDNNETL